MEPHTPDQKPKRKEQKDQRNTRARPLQLDLAKSRGQHVSSAGGLQLLMPSPPYESQTRIMETMAKALQAGEHALIESGTGTGKTLALLVGALAWLREAAPGTRIIYLSRTHSQLRQVVEELGRTAYSPRVLVYGSREQLCCNPALKGVGGSFLDFKCSELRRKGGCKYHQASAPKEVPDLLDIEGLQTLGKQHGCCPYYTARKRLD
jgi:regulator of telomere elongation helicase 1